ncbi:hypothetical protein [Clostridium sp. C8-1-8]|uniref:hypothetical protein n=1 Tax=Clostridium sp. C8-1-8 TaxID=2698831 RepID=UPI00136EC62C|nr:hypothetical protein [Clostridium sp. C8-1-8]
MNKTDALWIRAEKVKPLEGFQDILCHADKYSLVWKDAAGNETIVSAEQFCKVLEDSPVYKDQLIIVK